MSSHHIVKDEQEPALLIDDLDHFAWEMLGQLLEWTPTVIANEHSADQLINAQVKVDLVLSETPAFVERGLTYLIDKKYPAVNIISSKLLIEGLFPFFPKLNIVLYHGWKKIYPIKSGFSKWKPAGEQLEILVDNSKIQYNGLKERNHPHYETISDGFFQIYFEQPYIFIAEYF